MRLAEAGRKFESGWLRIRFPFAIRRSIRDLAVSRDWRNLRVPVPFVEKDLMPSGEAIWVDILTSPASKMMSSSSSPTPLLKSVGGS